MIEISKCKPGSKRLLEFMHIVELCKRSHAKINVHWNIEADDIVLELPHGLKVRSIMFEGLSDEIVTSWLYSLYRIGENDISYNFMDDYSKHLEILGYSVQLFDDGYIIRW